MNNTWKKSSFSASNGACVEVNVWQVPGTDAGGVDVRDSKDKTGPVLHYTNAEWTAFLAGVRNGEFDL